MPNKMLIDASHPEETRVVVLRGNRVEEFDFESASKKQLRGNIYLAKVTRVEPSLQAAFVDYGGNRHGFLAFSEIHPDYYQIPVADRQALIEEDARAHRAEEERETQASDRRQRHEKRRGPAPLARRSSSADEVISGAGDEAPEALSSGDSDTATTQHATESDTSAEPQGSTEFWVTDQSSAHLTVAAEVAGGAEPEPDDAETAATDRPDGRDERPQGEETEEAAATDRSAVFAGSSDAADGATASTGDAGEGSDLGETADDVSESSEDSDDAAEDAREAADDAAEPEPASSRVIDVHAPDDETDESDAEAEVQVVEQIGGDALEEIPHRPLRLRRQYKIQEVIKRRQVLLVQVAKEERGTKGAALTTYLSLAGRYSVLMPNTARGGGISRKITSAADRKRLKVIAEELEVPEGMGIILRTAGAARTKQEVKRDFEYLLRMWETVRELTLRSTAPTLVYEEGSLIKRAIRDLYNKEIDEIVVAGDSGYREARDFMRMLMPSHAKNVKPYQDTQPIFARAGAEAQLDGMFTNQVTLKSGGYLVINQTEALVAIDVNSGRSTREHNIEDTALRTNLEAADEVARQLRLRDLAGLIVVDFIDMEEGRNNRAVERRMKDALKNDRARIQIGRISHFGLLEMSRQRIRTGVLEGSTVLCPHCLGAGMIRSMSSIALHVLRGLEDALLKNAQFNVTVRTRPDVALYILNQKRPHLQELELRFSVTITIAADTTLTAMTYFVVDRGEPAAPRPELRNELVRIDSVQPVYDDETEDDAEVEEEDEEAIAASSEGDAEAGHAESLDDSAEGEGEDDERAAGAEANDSDPARRRRRRRRRRGRDRDPRATTDPSAPQPSDDALAAVEEMNGRAARVPSEDGNPDILAEGAEEGLSNGRTDPNSEEGAATEARPSDGRRRRRSRRFEGRGPRNGREAIGEDAKSLAAGSDDGPGLTEADRESEDVAPVSSPPILSGSEAADLDEVPTHVPPPSDEADEPGPEHAAAPVATGSGGNGAEPDEPVAATEAAPTAEAAPAEAETDGHEAVPVEDETPRPKRSGWWQRAKATFGG